MKKDDYVGSADVSDFLEFLKAELPHFCHSYDYAGKKGERYRKHRWSCTSIFDAALPSPGDNPDGSFSGYFWPFTYRRFNPSGETCQVVRGNSLAESNNELRRLSDSLLASIDDGQHVTCLQTCFSILDWGGVVRGNLEKLFLKGPNLVGALRSIRSELADPDLDDETLGKTIWNSGLKMNSGYTKIFSCLNSNFIIYDGRVGAALGLLARLYCERNQAALGGSLSFPWGAGRGKAVRDPSTESMEFPKLPTSSSKAATIEHSKWNLRASWIVRALADDLEFPHGNDLDPVWSIEAALFMIGYDVRRQ